MYYVFNASHLKGVHNASFPNWNEMVKNEITYWSGKLTFSANFNNSKLNVWKKIDSSAECAQAQQQQARRRFTAFNIGGAFLELSQTSTMKFFCENN